MACLCTEVRMLMPSSSQLGNETFCFCGVCSGQHTLRTGLVKPPCSQLGVERILRLTKVKRSFQSTQDTGGGAKANVRRGRVGTPGGDSRGGLRPGRRGMEGGAKAQRRWWAPGLSAAAGRPLWPHQHTGRPECGALGPAQPRSRSSTSAPAHLKRGWFSSF